MKELDTKELKNGRLVIQGLNISFLEKVFHVGVISKP